MYYYDSDTTAAPTDLRPLPRSEKLHWLSRRYGANIPEDALRRAGLEPDEPHRAECECWPCIEARLRRAREARREARLEPTKERLMPPKKAEEPPVTRNEQVKAATDKVYARLNRGGNRG